MCKKKRGALLILLFNESGVLKKNNNKKTFIHKVVHVNLFNDIKRSYSSASEECRVAFLFNSTFYLKFYFANDHK
jgi:hypothetical protein